MANDSDFEARFRHSLRELTSDQLVERLVHWELSRLEAEEILITREGKAVERYPQALDVLLGRGWRNTCLLPKEDEIVLDVQLAMKRGVSQADAFTAAAERHEVDYDSVKRTYHRRKGKSPSLPRG